MRPRPQDTGHAPHAVQGPTVQRGGPEAWGRGGFGAKSMGKHTDLPLLAAVLVPPFDARVGGGVWTLQVKGHPPARVDIGYRPY